MCIMDEESRLCTVISFKAKLFSPNKFGGVSILIKDRLSIINLLSKMFVIASEISSFEILDKKPNLPVLKPRIGISESFIRLIVFNKVPSPPMLNK